MTLKEIFQLAAEKKASDVHLVTGQRPIFRIDGVLYQMKEFPVIEAKKLFELLESILDERQKNIFFGSRELDLSYEISREQRFRVNLFWEKGNPALAARVIWLKTPTLEEIGMPPITQYLLQQNQGLILVTGPTGCGK